MYEWTNTFYEGNVSGKRKITAGSAKHFVLVEVKDKQIRSMKICVVT
jgi:hypothetical protein